MITDRATTMRFTIRNHLIHVFQVKNVSQDLEDLEDDSQKQLYQAPHIEWRHMNQCLLVKISEAKISNMTNAEISRLYVKKVRNGLSAFNIPRY